MKSKYLKTGGQTEVTPELKKLVSKIPGDDLVYIANSLGWVRNNVRAKTDISNKDELFRKRTAVEIVESGFSTGCTDTALVFITLSRAKGIPTKYIEAIDKRWLDSKRDGGEIKGRIFAECLIDGKWHKVDPAMLTIHAERVYPHHVIFAEGLDSWDIGIRSFEDLKEKFYSFREKMTPPK